MDLDADAKLNFQEFLDAVRPIENFTAKKTIKIKPSKVARPKSNLLHRKRGSVSK